ncbi:MAG: PVC-type heme-binding CxxCH protein [Gemmataceae bacterium]
MRFYACLSMLAFELINAGTAAGADANRLTYLDENNPYYVSRTFPRLATPQWIGEEGVEAVVILAIDDMRETAKYEKFLRPILQRLKKIDGRAPVSIMTCKIDPDDPQLQAWLKEGLSLETHTIDHPCPLLQGNDFAKAKSTYDRCVDLLHKIPGNRPVAFRVPCCDSLNTPSPRFFAEMFDKITPQGNFLTIDSSVINLITSNDPALPRELVIDKDGQDRFRKYLPTDRTFVNTIEDYPYPYVLSRLCWEFPCVMPSDWLAQHRHQPNNPTTVSDWKAALDAAVLKQGAFNLIFHPHGWIRSEQIVDLIDYAASKYGKIVKFLTFREAQERLNKNLLAGNPIRTADGQDNGVRLIDLNNDGFLDVVIGNDKVRQTRVWSPKSKTWVTGGFPVQFVRTGEDGKTLDERVCCGIVQSSGYPSLVVRNGRINEAWQFDGEKWIQDKTLLAGLNIEGQPILTSQKGQDRGVRFRDLDKDGRCELLVSNEEQQAIFTWLAEKKSWSKLPFALPEGTSLVNADGKDNGLRFVDIDEDGHEDVVFSNEKGYSLHLFTSMEKGWSQKVFAGSRGGQDPLPIVARAGSDNGAWFHSRHLWVQNEQTAALKDHVDRRSLNELLQNVEPAAKSPEASLRAIRTRPGFQVELAAAEPLVQSPIAFAWGADGRLWVVEMGDYPQGVDGKGKPGGRIKVLHDTNGDGKYTKATVFLDNLSLPTSVLPWGKGVLVTCAPDIFYAEDTKGTGKADKRVPLYTGFHEGNPQHRVNSLVRGLDNWIYCANGDSGGAVTSVKTGASVDIRGRDFRIHPQDGGLDLQPGQTQYGRSRDDWGNWFGNNNSNPLYHYVLSDQYIRRNPYVASPDPRRSVSEVPGASPVFPVSRTLPRFNDPETANHFTSACSAIIYRDDLFGAAFAGNSFVSEPVHNLIHREIVSPNGVTFTSRRAPDEQQTEFLASSDNWFRPTTIQTGPDGALWVADMYRQVIEHPEWIPLDWQKRLDLRAGHDKGRIYRVFPIGEKPRCIPRLDRLDTAGLVAALDSANGWQRDTAQQLLLEQHDKAAIPLLEKLAQECKRPVARLHALCTLDGLQALKPNIVRRALADSHPGVRRHAIRLSEPFLAQSPELGDDLVKLAADADPQVRLQLAYTLGEWNAPDAGRALGELAVREAGDHYISAAVMSSVNAKNLDRVLLAVLESSRQKGPPAGLMENLLRMANALDHTQAMITLLKAVATPEKDGYAPWQYTALAGLLDSLDQRNTSLTKLRASNEEMQGALKQLSGLFDAARATLANPKAPKEKQLLAIRILGRGVDKQAEDVAALAELLVPQTGADLQTAAIAALGRLRDARVPELLLAGWKGYGPAQRSQTLDVLFRRDEWAAAALEAIEAKRIVAAELDAARRQCLLQHKSAAVRQRAAKLFAAAIDPDRQKVVDAYQCVVNLQGDPRRGTEVFAKNCATCHKLGDVGHEVGPDLASLGDKSPQAIMIAVLDPNRAVEARYVNYTATTKAGLTHTGVLTSETGNSVTLVGPDGKKQVILRTDLEELISTGKSAMPEGLEKEIKPQDLADLIAHIRSVGPERKPKSFEGNKPELVQAAEDGSLVLLPSNCEIYGPTLLLEKQYGNLGYWTSRDDHAIWSVKVAKAGKYAVWLDWACDDASAGKKFLLQAGPNQLTGAVASTGNWDTYRQAKVGEILLPAGQQRLTFRSAERIFNALIDLKSIKLVPVAGE